MYATENDQVVITSKTTKRKCHCIHRISVIEPSRHVLTPCRVTFNPFNQQTHQSTDMVVRTQLKKIKWSLRVNQRKMMKIGTQTAHVMFYHQAKFFSPPAFGAPSANGRTDGRCSVSATKEIEWSLRTNKSREKVEIWYTNPTCHILLL